MNDQFNLDFQYKQYLKRVNLHEENMPKAQRVEMKRVFMGACGQMLVILRDELSKYPEDESIIYLQNMFDQVGNFFLKETNKQN